MNDNIIEICSGKIIDDENYLSAEQFCEICRIDNNFLLKIIDEGILKPQGSNFNSFKFTYSNVETVRIVIRLQNDLGINLPGAALAIQLLKQIKSSRI